MVEGSPEWVREVEGICSKLIELGVPLGVLRPVHEYVLIQRQKYAFSVYDEAKVGGHEKSTPHND